MKHYTVEKEINGKKYTAQFAGLSVAMRSVDETYIAGTNINSIAKTAEFLFKYVIVEPKGLTVDDFDTADEINEVMNFAKAVMEGHLKAE